MKVIHLLRDVQLRVLIIDEIHHILAGHIAKQRHFLNVLKYLGNELKIPLVGVGTIDALRAIQTDPQMVNRFEPVSLPRWEMTRDFQMLLASFERTLPIAASVAVARTGTCCQATGAQRRYHRRTVFVAHCGYCACDSQRSGTYR